MIGVFLGGLERHGEPYSYEDGKTYVSLPERLPDEERDDSTTHIATGNENLLDIAVLYYGGAYRNPVDLWQVIAQFQEETIIDPSVPVEKGTVVLIPSVDYCTEIAFGEMLSDYPQI